VPFDRFEPPDREEAKRALPIEREGRWDRSGRIPGLAAGIVARVN
jgi:hypothetical protein